MTDRRSWAASSASLPIEVDVAVVLSEVWELISRNTCMLREMLCDEVAWSLLGISMAGWNAIASAVLAFLWLRAYASSSASQ